MVIICKIGFCNFVWELSINFSEFVFLQTELLEFDFKGTMKQIGVIFQKSVCLIMFNT